MKTENVHSILESVKFIGKALTLIWQSSKSWSLVNILFLIIRGTIPMMMLWVVKLLIDTTTQLIATHNVDFQTMIPVLTLTSVLFVVNSVTASLHAIVKERQGYYMHDHITDIIHQKSTKINYGYFEDSKYQDIFYRALNEASFRPQHVFYGIASVLQNLITLALLGLILMSISHIMLTFILVASVPIVVYRIRYSRRYFMLMRRLTSEVRKVDYYNRLLTAKEFAKEVRLFDLGSLFRSNYVVTYKKLRKRQFGFMVKKTIRETFMQLIMALLLVAVFGYVIWQAIEGDITVGAMAMYFMALHRGYGIMQELLIRIASLYEDNLFLKNFFEFLDLKTDEETRVGHFPNKISTGVSVKNVSFKYPNTKRNVLKNISLDIKAGETVAIVGGNGSGKTSLVKLLCGLYKPTTGNIYIDNVPLDTIPSQEIADGISVIFQDFMLYNVSARDNIWFGNVHREPNDAAVRTAAQQAGIASVFDGLKRGYDTKLGTLFPNSEMLSQGEWQRTALARSFFNNSQIIILDEPTSSLDAFTEADLIDNFRAIVDGRTAIIISHRLSTIKMADRIIVLKDNVIEEQGRLDDLIAAGGYFSEMMKKLQ